MAALILYFQNGVLGASILVPLETVGLFVVGKVAIYQISELVAVLFGKFEGSLEGPVLQLLEFARSGVPIVEITDYGNGLCLICGNGKSHLADRLAF